MVWGDAAQKSAQGGCGAAGGLVGGGGQGRRARGRGRRPSLRLRPPSEPPAQGAQLSSAYSPLRASVPSACGRGVSLKSRPPLPGLGARNPQGPPPSSPTPGGHGSHLGAGADPAHRPEQQQRQAERAGGASHGGALRTGPSLPPAEPRAATDPGRPAAPGEEPTRGRPARGRGWRGPAFSAPAARGLLHLSPVGPRPRAPGAALRERTGRTEKRRSLPPAPSAAGPLVPPTPAPQPPPGSPKFLWLRKARPSPPHPPFRLPQKKLGLDQRLGLVQGHTTRKTPPVSGYFRVTPRAASD